MSNRIQSYDHDVCVYDDVMITMRDGARMCATVRFPARDGKVDFSKKYPVILQRTGYRTPFDLGPNPGSALEQLATANGYAYVVISGRGTWHSEGQLEPLANEGWGQDDCPDRGGWGVHKDGIDCINWVKRQPWCNGQIATSGMSWHGAAQLLPWLADNNLPVDSSAIFYPAMNSGRGNWGYENGFYTLELQIIWTFIQVIDHLMHHRYAPAIEQKIRDDLKLLGDPLEGAKGYANVMNTGMELAKDWVPKTGILNLPVLRYVPFWRKWVENRDNVDFFSYNDTTGRKHAFRIPMLFVGGYYDVFNRNAFWAYEQAMKDAPTKEIADGHRLIMTPYGHALNRGGEMFNAMRTDFSNLIMEWTDRQIKGEKSDFFDKAKVYVYVQGEEKWRAETAFPLAGTQYTEYYLHSGGNAVSSSGDGTLSTQKPAAEPADHYTADPANPAPSIYDHRLGLGGYGDIRAIGERSDVVVYTTPVLEEDVEVTGWVNASIYASTSATDSDFIMRLMDVYPDGRVMHVSMGGCRGRYRKDRRTPEAMVPGQIEKLDIPMLVSSCMFKAGHRISVEIVSAAAYMYDINPNAFIDLNTCTAKDYVIAEQTIYHDAEHPSSITLPIIPKEGHQDWVEWPFDPAKTGGVYDGDPMGTMQSGLTRKLNRIELNPDDLPFVD